MSANAPIQPRDDRRVALEVPAPTAWPICAAFGVVLLFAGMVTATVVGVLGAGLAIAGFVGWFREVLPAERHETLAFVERVVPVVTRHPRVARAEPVTGAPNRARLPLEIYPISAGVKGGLAGSVATAICAILYGAVRQHSVFYAINLLAAGFFPGMESTKDLAAFHGDAFLIASLIHLSLGLLIGLLYGAMLPMVPRRPILLAGVVAPILWTGIIHSCLGVVNPVMNSRIDWPWFVVSQMAYGIVAGIVVTRQERVRTWQHLPLDVRAGMEVQRDENETNGDRPPR
jgi:hypothetical protein